MYLNSITYFRGISIILIVLGHAKYLSNWIPNTIFENILFSLILGATAQFVFISGFLFHHKFYVNFNFRKFMKSKFKNVLIPYLILSTPVILYHSYERLHSSKLSLYILYNILVSYLCGNSSIAFWYIPFVMVLFLLSPIFLKYIKFSLNLQLTLFIMLSLVSILIHRPYNDVYVLHHVLYYIPVYMLGIICSMYKHQIYTFSKGKEFIYLLISILFVILQVYFTNRVGNYHKSFIECNGLDFVYLQKIFLSLFFMTLLNRFENYKLKILLKIAEASFAIFFLHSILFYFYSKLPFKKYFIMLNINFKGADWIYISFILLFLSYFIGKLIRLIVPNKSRLLIGW